MSVLQFSGYLAFKIKKVPESVIGADKLKRIGHSAFQIRV